jgi:polyhydroxyalkanoate synthesis regulator phasin
MNEAKKSIQDLDEKFSKEIEIMKQKLKCWQQQKPQ